MRRSLLLIFGAAIGCSPTPPTIDARSGLENPNDPQSKPAVSRITADSGSTVEADKEFVVTGAFTHSANPPQFATVKIIRKTQDGNEVIVWSGNVMPEAEGDHSLRFATRAKAPREGGLYRLRAEYARDKVAESEITVK